MSKMSELAAELSELKRCGESLISISETLTQMFSSDCKEDKAEPIKENKEKKLNKNLLFYYYLCCELS